MNIQRSDGRTALMGASEYGSADVVGILLEAGQERKENYSESLKEFDEFVPNMFLPVLIAFC